MIENLITSITVAHMLSVEQATQHQDYTDPLFHNFSDKGSMGWKFGLIIYLGRHKGLTISRW